MQNKKAECVIPVAVLNDLIICDQILENLPFGHKQNFEKTQLKIFTILFKIKFFLHIWIKQVLNLLAVKFHTNSFFFLGDMDDYIRLTNVPKR